MPLWADPQYQRLAGIAAFEMGSKDSDIRAAILAQWTCEKGNSDTYPPARNNPGNLSQGAASGLGYSFIITFPNPQPGNPIVTYHTPEDGARAYATLLNNGTRYAGVRKAVKAGDGPAFIRAMGKSGYGTSTACMFSAYHPTAQPDPPPVQEGATDMAILVQAPGSVVEIPSGGRWWLDSELKHLGAAFPSTPTEVTYFGWCPSGPSRAVIIGTKIVNGGPAAQDTLVYVSPNYPVKTP